MKVKKKISTLFFQEFCFKYFTYQKFHTHAAWMEFVLWRDLTYFSFLPSTKSITTLDNRLE